jgi:enoyl-CoA hydratase/carnithine racemase
VVSQDSIKDATALMASKIASKSSMTLATGKKAFYAQREMSLSDAYQYASEVMVMNMLAQDAKEGIDAFIEKRKPQWQNK